MPSEKNLIPCWEAGMAKESSSGSPSRKAEATEVESRCRFAAAIASSPSERISPGYSAKALGEARLPLEPMHGEHREECRSATNPLTHST